MCRSSRGKKKGFGFGGFSLTSSFHKAGELGPWQKERRDDRWNAAKHKSEKEFIIVLLQSCENIIIMYIDIYLAYA